MTNNHFLNKFFFLIFIFNLSACGNKEEKNNSNQSKIGNSSVVSSAPVQEDKKAMSDAYCYGAIIETNSNKGVQFSEYSNPEIHRVMSSATVKFLNQNVDKVDICGVAARNAGSNPQDVINAFNGCLQNEVQDNTKRELIKEFMRGRSSILQKTKDEARVHVNVVC